MMLIQQYKNDRDTRELYSNLSVVWFILRWMMPELNSAQSRWKEQLVSSFDKGYNDGAGKPS